jgi:hypothetical protein
MKLKEAARIEAVETATDLSSDGVESTLAAST